MRRRVRAERSRQRAHHAHHVHRQDGDGARCQDLRRGPLQAKCRIVVQGPRETLGETEQRDTSSPTLPEEAPHVFFTIAVSMGWIVQQGDVEAAFLNGLRLDRELILQAPREGLPAIPGVMEAVPGGAYFQALKGVYGINDAPNLWGGRHADGMLEN